MSHIAFYTESLPAAHYLFTQILGAQKTRHDLDRTSGAEWVDFISADFMGRDQVSIHLDPKLKTPQNNYTMEEIADLRLGKQELQKCLKSPSETTATVGHVKAPMPHWGPVNTTAKFEEIIARFRAEGFGEDIVQTQTHHQGKAAEHQTAFITLGGMNFELKGYSNERAITAGLPETPSGKELQYVLEKFTGVERPGAVLE